jgi:crotonobetainyl-CoA:carnitine CoA-transferase CaiB-like acyl-CoA transferase
MSLPLERIRIIDLTDSIVGPFATRLLANCGAEVIKVESRHHLLSRRFGPWGPKASAPISQATENQLDFSKIDLGLLVGPTFAYLNADKLSITLNLAAPEGRELFKKLVKISDIVIDNFRMKVMSKWGFEYSDLKRIKEDIIVVNLPSFGKGPHQDWVTWGMNLMSSSGFAHLWGHPDTPVVERVAGRQTSDNYGGTVAASAILAALYYRARTGKGQLIEIAQNEVAASALGVAYLDYFVNHRVTEPRGNRHPQYAPYNCYPCRGEDNWCVIAVFNEEDWHNFCQALDHPSWTKDSKFQDMAGRLKNVDELDENIRKWTGRHTPHQVMRILQLFGVAAGAVQNGEDLYYDLQLRFRGLTEEELPRLGNITFPDIPLHFSEEQTRNSHKTPVFGQHNDYVYRNLLHLTQPEIERLVDAKVIY